MLKSAPIFFKKETKILLGLERIERVLRYFGNPQRSFESCTVAGTVGKGQVAVNIAHNLSRFGKIALYTSPHLERFNERIKIVENGKEAEIESSEVEEISKTVFEAEIKTGVELTYFEHATVMAFLWFREKKVDFASLEVGMGGRLDATATAKSKIGVISKIHFDHTEFLGKTLYDIAREKTLCVPPESTRITIHKEGEEQFGAIKDLSKGKITNNFSIKEIQSEKEDIIFSKKKLEVGVEGKISIKVEFFGPEKAVENSVLSSVASHIILKEFFGKDIYEFSFDIRRTKGRTEKIGNFIYDGGHNPISAGFLRETLPEMKFVVAFMKDKDWKSFLEILKPKINYLYITRVQNERACEPQNIKDFAERINIPCKIILPELIPFELSKEKEFVCFTGTFYLYPVFKETLNLYEKRKQ